MQNGKMKKTILGIGFGMAMLAGSVAHAQQGASMTEVGDGVYHYFSDRYSSLVVVGDDGVLITDTSSDARAETLKAEIEKITDLPVTHIGLSHEHFDHVGGTGVFEDAKVVCHDVCDGIFNTSILFPVPDVDIEYTDSLSIDLGGRTVEVMQPAPGDGVGTSVFWVPDAKVAFSADMYNHRQFIFGQFKEDTNFLGVIKILETIESWDPEYVIEGHIEGDSRVAMQENLQMLTDLRDAVAAPIEQALAEGGAGAVFPLMFSLPNEIKLEAYEDWEGYDEQFPAYVRRMAFAIFHGG